MDSAAVTEEPVEVHVENIGGIDETSVTVPAGVTALVGRNATNRTSLLRAVMTALGSDDVSLKGDAEEGRVELRVGGETYARRLYREDGAVVAEGSGYAGSTTEADLFAFLLETNEARRAVRTGADLRDVVVRPIDTAEVNRRISRLEREREAIDAELAELDDLADRRVELERRREDLRDEVATKREALEEAEARIEAAEADVARQQAARDELEELLGELSSVREDREDVRYDLQTARESRDALEEERAAVRDELDSLGPVESDDDLTDRIDRLQRERQRLDSELHTLQQVIQFNRDQLEADALDGVLERGDGDVTDGLVADADETACWTCGSTVSIEQVEATLERLQAHRRELAEQRDDVDERLAECSDRQDTLADRRDRKRELEERLEAIAAEREERAERIAELEARRERLDDAVATLEADVEDIDEQRHDELLERQAEADRLRGEIERLEDERRSVESDLDAVTDRLDERDTLESQRAETAERLDDARQEVVRIERAAIEEFNGHMADLIDRLDYGNVERIWLERRVPEGSSGGNEAATFDLHVVRRTDAGAAYEDSVRHLSESEREVTGLVFALAGYVAHDVHETVPFVVMDSLEAIDAERIATLIEYVREYAPYLLVALLPEDAEHVATTHRITDI